MAFHSPNYPILAQAGVHIKYHKNAIRKPSERDLVVHKQFNTNVALLKLFPGISQNIVEAIISLAHRLNMIVVAEGVETHEQYTILSDMQCQFGQGYLFSKPLQRSEVDKLVAEMIRYSQENPGQYYPLTNDLAN